MNRAVHIGLVLWLWLWVVAPASADDTVKWGQVGGWAIMVDRTIGDGCFAMQVFERGTVVRIGFDMRNRHVYLFFAQDSWKSLEEGKVYPVRIVFDGSIPYDGEMRGQRLGNVVVLAHRNVSADFFRDFMQRNDLQVFYRGSELANLSLRNTYAAVSEVINCQKEIAAAGRSSGRPTPSATQPQPDPFASGNPSSAADPFR
jgi:hypothetical protein